MVEDGFCPSHPSDKPLTSHREEPEHRWREGPVLPPMSPRRQIPLLWAEAKRQEKGKKYTLHPQRQQGDLLVLVPISILFVEALFQEKMVISISYE